MEPINTKEQKPPEQSTQMATSSGKLIPTAIHKTSYTPKVTPGLGIDLEASIPYDPNEKTNKLDTSVPTFDGAHYRGKLCIEDEVEAALRFRELGLGLLIVSRLLFLIQGLPAGHQLHLLN